MLCSVSSFEQWTHTWSPSRSTSPLIRALPKQLVSHQRLKPLPFFSMFFLYLLTLIINIIYLHCYLIYQYPLPIHDHDLYLFYACAVPLPPVYFFVPFPFMSIYLLRVSISCTSNYFPSASIRCYIFVARSLG